MKRVAIHQPNFLPWSGYFHKMSLVDDFVFFDDVQFPRGKTFGNRVKIKTSGGELWLTVPVLSKSDLSAFKTIRINSTIPWKSKMLKTIELSYKKARFFDRYFGAFSEIMLEEHERLIDLNTRLIRFIIDSMNLKVKLHYSSEILSGKEADAGEKIIMILKELGAGAYITGSGAGSARYIDGERFAKEKIVLEWQHFESPVYPQLWGSFISGLSSLDLLFNCGDTSLEILKGEMLGH